MDRKVLIIGYGSGIRGDDALGPRTAEMLSHIAGDRFDGDPVTVLSRASLTPELAADLAEASLVIFIDCAATGVVGELVEREVAATDDSTVAMVHFLDPSGLLYWARSLFGRAPRAVTLSVAGASFEISDELSPPLAAALPGLVERAIALSSEHLQTDRSACHA